MLPDLSARLHQWRKRGLWREQQNQITVPAPTEPTADGLSFISNDYLGLSHHPKVIEAMVSATRRYGHGSGGSALMGGYHSLLAELEEQLASWLSREAAVALGSGFLANVAIGGAILGNGWTTRNRRAHWLLDHNAHASLLDGARLSGWPISRFRHNDCQHLARQLEQLNDNELAVISEGLFSMDGDSPCWSDLLAAVDQRAALIVDEAHSFGIFGDQGRGACADFSQVALVVVPLGKAIGGYGALVCGQRDYVAAVTQFARSYTYSTALPPAVVAGDLAALRLLPTMTEQRKQLQTNIAHLHRCLRQNEIAFNGGERSPIVLIPQSNNQRLMSAARQLRALGLQVGALRAPTVISPRLRLSIRAEHTPAQIERLVEALHKIHNA